MKMYHETIARRPYRYCRRRYKVGRRKINTQIK